MASLTIKLVLRTTSQIFSTKVTRTIVVDENFTELDLMRVVNEVHDSIRFVESNPEDTD